MDFELPLSGADTVQIASDAFFLLSHACRNLLYRRARRLAKSSVGDLVERAAVQLFGLQPLHHWTILGHSTEEEGGYDQGNSCHCQH